MEVLQLTRMATRTAKQRGERQMDSIHFDGGTMIDPDGDKL
jgi:hypothetical protein